MALMSDNFIEKKSNKFYLFLKKLKMIIYKNDKFKFYKNNIYF
jgi:hypothetical protein